MDADKDDWDARQRQVIGCEETSRVQWNLLQSDAKVTESSDASNTKRFAELVDIR